jgi:hypothetical protein
MMLARPRVVGGHQDPVQAVLEALATEGWIRNP